MSGFVLPTPPDYEGALLLARDVTMRFGGVTAVSELTLAVPQGAIAGIIGPNGAGKTTVFNVLSGFYTPQEGDVIFAGKSIKGRKPYDICRLGMARTFQNIRLSRQMTVLENIMVGCHVRRHCPWWMAPLGLPRFYREEAEIARKGVSGRRIIVSPSAPAAFPARCAGSGESNTGWYAVSRSAH